jgi:hypothetical protein
MEQSMKTKLTSYQQGSPANLSPKQGSVRELVMNVRFGHRFAEFYGKQNPNGSWAKTCQDSLQLMEDNTSVKSSMTWPKLGIALDGLCTGQKTLVLFTEGTESSSLPTPTAFDAHNIPIRNGHNLDRGGRHNVGLKDMIPVFADQMLPTPQAFDAKDFKKKDLADKTTKNGKRGGRSNLREVDFENMLPTPRANQAMAVDLQSHYAQNHKQRNLEVVIAKDMLATPRASQDHKPIRPLAPSEANGTHGKTLVADIGNQLLPTPTVQDAKNNGSESQQKRNTKPLNAVAINLSLEETGNNGESPLRLGLNPEFVEAMMGFPIGWTDLNPSETP